MVVLSPPSGNENFVNSSIFHIAREYHAAGVCTIPLLLDGTKNPAIRWKTFQTRLPKSRELFSWFHETRPERFGIATVTGAVSGGLEVLDFDRDAESIFPQWYYRPEVEPIAARLPIVETPSFGFHVLSRCSVVSRNTKIAEISQAEYEAEKAHNTAHGIDRKIKKVLIETRGEGGYVVNPSSPAAVHSLNTAYIQVAGPILPEIPEITPEERLTLWRAARALDRADLYEQQLRAAQPRPQRTQSVNGDEQSRFRRARAYLAKMQPSVSGANGHNRAFRAANVLIGQFGLSFELAMHLMHEFNERCVPPWSEKELQHKVESAMKEVGI